jgi:hypothetical protein
MHKEVHLFTLAVGAKRELELHIFEMELFEAYKRLILKKIYGAHARYTRSRLYCPALGMRRSRDVEVKDARFWVPVVQETRLNSHGRWELKR